MAGRMIRRRAAKENDICDMGSVSTKSVLMTFILKSAKVNTDLYALEKAKKQSL